MNTHDNPMVAALEGSLQGSWSAATRANTRPAFVRFGEGDVGIGMLNAFFEHPDNYTKYVGPDGRIRSWGLFPYIGPGKLGAGDEDIEPMIIQGRKFITQTTYASLTRPEDQFLKVVMTHKKAELKAQNMGQLTRRDYVLRIHMPEIKADSGEDRIWRRFVVSGGMSLGVLQDKILAPLMGWVRNFHAHVFTDYRDGAQFGPKGSAAVDMMHLDLTAYDFLNEDEYCVAHILQEVGHAIHYMYDLGDRYHHEITVEAILPINESCGAVEILSGSGICPMENGRGNHIWVEKLQTLKSGTARERRETLHEIYSEENCKARKWDRRPSFDPDWFDVDEARAAVTEALGSKASYPGGAKTFHMPMSPEAFFEGSIRAQYHAKKKATVEITHVPDSGGYFEELKRERQDRAKNSACAACGSPHDLKACSACSQRFYCSSLCQKGHWKSTHKQECPTLKKQRKTSK